MRIAAGLEKGNTDRLLPITPDFAEFLLQTPEEERTGYVFRPLMKTGKRAARDAAVRTIASVGGIAGVNVSPTKYASAHDLRRAFGNRWKDRVMPQFFRS